jgi:hypothetical protein
MWRRWAPCIAVRGRIVVVAVAAVVVMGASGGTARAAGPSEADIEAAKVHYQSGAQYYEGGSYDDAIREFNEAYRLSKATALLYNISQAYEKKGDYANARDFLKRYIDAGELEEGELPGLHEKLRTFDQKLKEQPKPPPREAPRPTPPPPPAPTVTAPPPAPPTTTAPPPYAAPAATEPSRPFRTVKWIAGGASVVCLGLATVFALDAKSQQKTIEDNQGRGLPYDQTLQDAYSRGQRDTTLTVVFGLAGVAAAATTVVMFVVDGNNAREVERPSARVVPFVAPQTAGAAVIYRF